MQGSYSLCTRYQLNGRPNICVMEIIHFLLENVSSGKILESFYAQYQVFLVHVLFHS